MQSSIKSILVIIFYSICGAVSAQNINVYFPYFAGKEYVYVLNRGLAKDTVQSGTISADGKATLVIPEKFKPYRGIGFWSVIGSGGIDFIVDNEDFSITCEDSIPNINNIFFSGSTENTLRNQYDSELSSLFQKLDSLYQANNITPNIDSLPTIVNIGILSIQKEYSVFRGKLDADTSYAAFFMKTINYMQGLGLRMYSQTDQKEFLSDFLHYIIDEIDIIRLYNSGLWMSVIPFTFNAFENETAWGEAMVKMLKRTISQSAFDILSKDLILATEQLGWNKAEQILVDYLETSNRLPAKPADLVSRAIAQNKVKIGNKAPLLNGETPSNALLIFYESGCDHCKNQLAEITIHYSELQEKGIRVISISVDENKEVFEYHANRYPWPDKLCDFKGYNGENVKNYSIVGTPTIYLIDKDGIIIDRQSRLQDIKALNFDSSSTN